MKGTHNDNCKPVGDDDVTTCAAARGGRTSATVHPPGTP